MTPAAGHSSRRRGTAGALLLVAAVLRVAHAGDPPRPVAPATLAGTAAFEWTRAKACVAVDAALLKKWNKSYTCMPPEEGVGTASGRTVQARCHIRRGRSEYLVFATMADCKEERETQLANE